MKELGLIFDLDIKTTGQIHLLIKGVCLVWLVHELSFAQGVGDCITDKPTDQHTDQPTDMCMVSRFVSDFY